MIATKTEGNTLLEVLVAGAIFGLLSVVLVLTMRTNRASQLKTDAQSQTQRACLNTMNQLRNALRGVQVVIPSVGTNGSLLRYYRPVVGSDGMVVVTPAGLPSFSTTPVTLTLDSSGKLTSNETPPRILGRLFANGSVNFRRVSKGVLEVDLRAAQSLGGPERKSQSRIVSRIPVRNS